MKTTYLYCLMLTLFIFIGSCATEDIQEIREGKEELNTDPAIAQPSMSLQASMPADEGGTRIALTLDEKNVRLTWEEGDSIYLLYVQNDRKIGEYVVVKNISADRKKAGFDITLPEAIEDGTFDLYGVYGRIGVNSDDPSRIYLPMHNSDGSLQSLQEEKQMMMIFKEEGLSTATPQATVTFNHEGSLFCIQLMNTGGGSLNDLVYAKLYGNPGGWALNNDGGSEEYILTEARYTGDADNYIRFSSPESSLAPGDTLSIWGWFPTLPDVNWPQLDLDLEDSVQMLYRSSNSKPARTSPTAPGKSYYFYAACNGSDLHFTDSRFSATEGEQATDLFFSEYVEGSDNNKYFEFYNGTGEDVDLSAYRILLYKDGSTSPFSYILNGTLSNGAVRVFKYFGASIYKGVVTQSSVANFDGNDALVLEKTTDGGDTYTPVDIIGCIGENPGTSWTADGGYSTENKTLRRKSLVRGGITVNPDSGFPTLATEWDLYDQDVVSGLGNHIMEAEPSGGFG